MLHLSSCYRHNHSFLTRLNLLEHPKHKHTHTHTYIVKRTSVVCSSGSRGCCYVTWPVCQCTDPVSLLDVILSTLVGLQIWTNLLIRPTLFAHMEESCAVTFLSDQSIKIDRITIKGNSEPYRLRVKSFRSVRFFMFLNEVSSAHQGCFIWWKKMTNSNVVKYYDNLKWLFSM